REIKISYTVRELPVVVYTFTDLDRLQRYFNGMLPRWELVPHVEIRYAAPGAQEAGDMADMLAAFDEHDPGFRVLYQDDGRLISLKSEDLVQNRINIRPSLGVYLNDPAGAFKYEIGIAASIDRRLARRTYFTGAVNYNIYETVSDVTQPSNSTLPHVRSDIAEYKRASDFKLTRFLVNQLYFPAERVYARASAGIYEEMFGGAGAQVLYLPRGAGWGADLAVDWVKQRDYDGWGFRDYDTVTTIASFHYRLPLGITATARGGRFLARDEGVRFEIKRRFASGYEAGFWYTRTNGNDITSPGSPGSPYYDKGIFLAVPISTLLTKDTQAVANMSLAPWTRDVGQMVVSPLDLYRLMEKPLVIDVHEHDGLVQLGDRDDDYHRVQ
ncbi:MAG TPA: YjbH domain-containing protein, partial [Burkholderiales bacterium]